MRHYKKIIFIFIFLFLTGCTNEVKDDFKHFLNVDILPISNLESEAITAFNDISNKDKNSEMYYQQLYTVLSNTCLPKYKDFVANLSSIVPETIDVKQIHQIYLKGAEKQLEAFELFKQGIEEKNEYKISEANRLLTESKTYMTAYLKSAIELADELDLKWR